MKKTQFILSLIFIFLVSISYAQDVNYKNKTYTVKGKSIYLAKENITEKLNEDAKKEIFLANKINVDKAKKIAKDEKKLKQAEKKAKKVEKALKTKAKAQNSLKKAKKKLNNAIKKHQSFKIKGDLSPNDSKKWLSKIEKYKNNVEKAEKRLAKS
ncbi:hypothetical protein [Polaribacter sp. Asnod1-A03]|uniref:hypothetical protein n=1 Tax=Polaribacter sp. Asnod1-A03 TaxID=3160581 RepID=UPI0038697F63